MRKRIKTEALAVHHSASGIATTLEQIENWHTMPIKYGGRGWEKCGYHFVLPADGEVKIGREESLEGTQVAGFNHKSIGICLCGDFRWNVPTTNQIESLIGLCAELVKKYDLKYWNIYAHKDIKRYFVFNTTDTDCPGKNLYKLLTMVRATVGARLGQIGHDPNKTFKNVQ